MTVLSQNRHIAAISGYLPLLRLDRTVASKALRFSGLGGRQAGYRATSGWDEDALTMSVESARIVCNETKPSKLIFASTSAPFTERGHAPLIADALALPATLRTNDVSGTRRCAVSALLDALLGQGDTLVAAGEKRETSPGSPFDLAWGDGSAAVLVCGEGGAELIGHASLSHDLIDLYASREHPTPYASEERFVRETATRTVIGPTVKAALADAGIAAGDIAQAAVCEPLPNMWRDIAKATGIVSPNHASDLAAGVGDLGAAHGLFALALAFDAAQPGELVLVAGFGSGCDAMVFRVNGPVPGAAEAKAALNQGVVLSDYVRFLSLTGSLKLDWGARSEFEQKAQTTVLSRYGRDAMGFIGGRDAAGNVQFPKSLIPVRPDAGGPEVLEDVRLADLSARLVSVTADRLNFTPDPPFWFGLVQFENGARLPMEFTDADQIGFSVGDAVTMRLRIKSLNKRLGFRTYFWKAAPSKRPEMES